jgi:hypothetical protein
LFQWLVAKLNEMIRPNQKSRDKKFIALIDGLALTDRPIQQNSHFYGNYLSEKML